ncbi:MAG: transporter permease [Glaciihabitans sp.]|nr:transporter permease [Glaciihabitans sp.]
MSLLTKPPVASPAAPAAGEATAAAPSPGSPSRFRLGLRAFGRDKAAVIAAIVLLLVMLSAIFAPLLTPYDPLVGDPSQRLLGIGTPGHPLGLDGQGRDMLSRLLYGGRFSLTVAIVPVLVVFPVALMIGLLAGYAKGHVGEILMRLLDVIFAFPLVLLAIAIAAVFGAGLGNVMIAIGITLVPYMARVAYTSTVQESAKEYIEAARASGASVPQILFRELLPNVVSPLLVYATTLCGLMIVVASGLSFLGVGVVPPAPDWGIMASDGGKVLLEGYYHVASVPGVMILIVALSFNLIGDGLRDAMDPRKQTS